VLRTGPEPDRPVAVPPRSHGIESRALPQAAQVGAEKHPRDPGPGDGTTFTEFLPELDESARYSIRHALSGSGQTRECHDGTWPREFPGWTGLSPRPGSGHAACRERTAAPVLDDGVRLLGEVVTNAVAHSDPGRAEDGRVTVPMGCEAAGVRVEVRRWIGHQLAGGTRAERRRRRARRRGRFGPDA
jgi:hypothetical protein